MPAILHHMRSADNHVFHRGISGRKYPGVEGRITFAPDLEIVLIYLMMVAVLMVRPWGLLGRPAVRDFDTDDLIEIRWPALFFGFRRCVYVTWTPSDVEFRDVSGRACTELLD